MKWSSYIVSFFKKLGLNVSRESDRDLDLKTEYPGRKIREDEGKGYTVISKSIPLPEEKGIPYDKAIDG